MGSELSSFEDIVNDFFDRYGTKNRDPNEEDNKEKEEPE